MNKPIIVVGLIVFIIFLVFPPFHYRTIENIVLSDSTGVPPSFKTTFLPFWHNGEICKNGEWSGTGAKIYTDLWYGLLGGVAFISIALAIIFKKKERNPSSQ
jgi:hypothetical protein